MCPVHVALSFWHHVCFCRCCQCSEGSNHTTAPHLLLEGAFPLFPCHFTATKVLGLNTVCLHYDYSVRLPMCWYYGHFFNLYLERIKTPKQNKTEYQLSSGSISINQRWNMPSMTWNTLHRHLYSYSNCLETPRWSAKGLWDPAMKEESPTALHSWIDYRSLCTLSEDLRLYSAAESEGLYTCCWVLNLTTVHHTEQVVLHSKVHLRLCDRFIKAKIILRVRVFISHITCLYAGEGNEKKTKKPKKDALLHVELNYFKLLGGFFWMYVVQQLLDSAKTPVDVLWSRLIKQIHFLYFFCWLK